MASGLGLVTPRVFGLGGAMCVFAALGFAPACGESASDGDEPAGQAGSSSATAGAGGGSAGTTGTAGTTSAAGSSSAGSSTAGSSSAGSSSGGGKPSGGGQATGGDDSGAGAANGGAAGASTELVDCDPLKITCKRAAPQCPAGQVPSIDNVGNCYGDCVKIDRCACSTAQQCPDNNQYTCWAKQHCGPYVQ